MAHGNVRGRKHHFFRIVAWSLLLLFLLSGSASGAPRSTTFVHPVGFSFDYPSKWSVKRLEEGLLLAPHDAETDVYGRPLEVIVVGFLGAESTDPFAPSFADAFERHYRKMVPDLSRIGDMDWIESSMGLGLMIPFDDRLGNPHRVYCAVHGQLGIFLAHVSRLDTAPSRIERVRKIFASFGWTESLIDPALVRSWDTPPAASESDANERVVVDGQDRWVFADDGRLRRSGSAAIPTPRSQNDPVEIHGGFYASSRGVLNIVWDHGLEESYRYTLSERPGGGSQLELRTAAGDAFRLH